MVFDGPDTSQLKIDFLHLRLYNNGSESVRLNSVSAFEDMGERAASKNIAIQPHPTIRIISALM